MNPKDTVTPYEQRLDGDLNWAFEEGDRYFADTSAVWTALRRIARRLDDAGLPYALTGALAMFLHGFRRFTEDVDLIVTANSRKTIHERFVGDGYVPCFVRSKNVRDTEYGVRVDLRAQGEFPGDGKPQPVTFPDPRESVVVLAGFRVLTLPKLIELKLASGLSGGWVRLRDHADVIALIQKRRLAAEFTDELQEAVRAKYVELWTAVHTSPRPDWDEVWDD